MRRTTLVAALMMLPVAAAFAAPDASDQAFVTQAAQGGIAEVELGKLATQKGSTPEVRSFGQQMVLDHEQANGKLEAIARKKGLEVPTRTDAAHEAAKQKLQGLTGAAFDREYLTGQVADHEKTVALMKKQSASGKDAELKAFASETLPVVQQHHEIVKKLHAGGMASPDKSHDRH